MPKFGTKSQNFYSVLTKRKKKSANSLFGKISVLCAKLYAMISEGYRTWQTGSDIFVQAAF